MQPLPRISTAKPQPLRAPGLPNAVNVLVIDNERAILDGMETLLTGWGFIVHRARSQAEAVKALQTAGGKLDMILADYHLIREDGISVVRALRKRARKHRRLVVAAATGLVLLGIALGWGLQTRLQAAERERLVDPDVENADVGRPLRRGRFHEYSLGTGHRQ